MAEVRQFTFPVIAQVTFDANLPANTPKPIRFIRNPLIGPEASMTVPQGEAWVLTDCYIKAAGDVPVDALVYIRKNDREDVYRSPPLSTLLISNPARPRISPPKPMFRAGDTISGLAVNLAAIGASAQTVTFYLEFFCAAAP